MFHLTQWFDEESREAAYVGFLKRTWPLQASGKTKCSAAPLHGGLWAVSLRGVDGTELYNKESVPSEARIMMYDACTPATLSRHTLFLAVHMR